MYVVYKSGNNTILRGQGTHREALYTVEDRNASLMDIHNDRNTYEFLCQHNTSLFLPYHSKCSLHLMCIKSLKEDYRPPHVRGSSWLPRH